MPFSVLVGAMSCYLNLSRRLELVIARAAGVSAWQFIAPAIVIALLIGIARDHDLQSSFGCDAGEIGSDGGGVVPPRQEQLS